MDVVSAMDKVGCSEKRKNTIYKCVRVLNDLTDNLRVAKENFEDAQLFFSGAVIKQGNDSILYKDVLLTAHEHCDKAYNEYVAVRDKRNEDCIVLIELYQQYVNDMLKECKDMLAYIDTIKDVFPVYNYNCVKAKYDRDTEGISIDKERFERVYSTSVVVKCENCVALRRNLDNSLEALINAGHSDKRVVNNLVTTYMEKRIEYERAMREYSQVIDKSVENFAVVYNNVFSLHTYIVNTIATVNSCV